MSENKNYHFRIIKYEIINYKVKNLSESSDLNNTLSVPLLSLSWKTRLDMH